MIYISTASISIPTCRLYEEKPTALANFKQSLLCDMSAVSVKI